MRAALRGSSGGLGGAKRTPLDFLRAAPLSLSLLTPPALVVLIYHVFGFLEVLYIFNFFVYVTSSTVLH